MGSAGAVMFDTGVWSTKIQHTCAQAGVKRQERLPLIIPCQQERWLTEGCYFLGRWRRSWQGTCLWSFYFTIHKTSSVQPWGYRRGVRGQPRFWPCWKPSAAWAAGGMQHAGHRHLLCQGGGRKVLAGSMAWLTWHTELPQPGRWMGSARLPASQQTTQVESMESPGSSDPTSVFISNIRGAILRLCSGGRGHLAFVHSNFSFRHQNSHS